MRAPVVAIVVPVMSALAIVVALAPSACTCAAPPPVTPPSTPLPPSVTVVAGTVSRGVADGVGPDARFDGPAGLAVSSDGRTAYVADTFVGTVRKVDVETGATTTLLGKPFELVSIDGAGADVRFASPRGLAVSPDGATLWVGDGASLRRVDLTTLEVETVAGDQANPGDVDAAGREARFEFLLHDLEDDGSAVYATDRVNDKVKRVDTTTFDVVTIADGFDGPGGLTRDGATLFVADTFANRIVSLDLAAFDVDAPALLPLTVVATGVDAPQGVERVAADGGALWALGFDAIVTRIDVANGAPTVEVSVVFEGNPAAPTEDGAGNRGNIGGAFASLGAVANGALFVDLASSAVRKIVVVKGEGEGESEVITVAGPETPYGREDGAGALAKFQSPYSVTASADGAAIFVADTFNHAVRVIDVTRDGDTLSYEVRSLVGRGVRGFADGAPEDARLSFPVGLALDEDNQLLYVADSASSRIRVIELKGLATARLDVVAEERTVPVASNVRTLAGSGARGGADGPANSASFADPWDLALDVARGHLYVADSSGSTVRRVDTATGDVETVLGVFGDNDHVDGTRDVARIRVPVGVALGGSDFVTLYISDFEAHTIRALDTDSLECVTVHGEDGFAGFAEGEAEFALLSSPSGLTATPDGSAIFVAETGSHVVRRLATDTHGSRFVVGQASLGGGQGTGRAFSYDEATLLAPEDVVFAAHAEGVVDLVILSEHGVVHAVSVPE